MLKKTRWEAKSRWGGTKDLRTPSEVAAAPREGCWNIPCERSFHPGDRRRRGPALRSPAPANADQWESRMLACGRCGWVATAGAGRRRALPEEPGAVRHGRAGR